MALDVSRRLKTLLEDAGLRVRMTRSDDTYVSLSGRATLANSAGADRFVSIHNNAHTSDASGTETFMYTSGSANSRDLRDRIQREMIRAWMLPNRGGKTANFYVLRYTSMPATLSELAFISRCSPDAELIGDPDARQEMAEAHFIAIAGHLGIDTTPPPMDGTLTIVVYEDTGLGEEDTSRRLGGATVTLAETEASGESDPETGEVPFTAPAGTYTVRATLEGYAPAERECALDAALARCAIGLSALSAEGDAGTGGELPQPDGGTAPPEPVRGGVDRGMAKVDGCSASGADAGSILWVLALLVLALVARARRGRARLVLAACVATIAIGGCDRAVDPARRSDAIAASGERVVDVRPAASAIDAATVEPFAALRGDRVVLAEELGGAVISPDGERIALTMPGHRGLRIVELSTGAERELSVEPRAGWLPLWRADSLAIAYRSEGQTGSAVPLHAVTVDGASVAPFVQIAGAHFVERDERIVRIDEGGHVRSVSPDVDGERFIAPVRSPDGRHVVFLGLSTGLYVHRIDDGRTAALGPGTSPSFSADGRFLVFSRTEDDGHRLTAGDLYLTYLDHDAMPTGRLTDTADRIEVSPSLDATATRIAYIDEVTSELRIAALELTDTTALDDPDARFAPHIHHDGAPAHTHPHVTADDPWHVTLGHR